MSTLFASRRTAAATAVAAGLGSAAVVLTAGPAFAVQAKTVTLAPGASTCVTQYAGYQVRGDGSATADGARFKLLLNGQVLDATLGRVTGWADERRTSTGTFPGAGYYAACAYNTGTRNTTVFLRIQTDGEI